MLKTFLDFIVTMAEKYGIITLISFVGSIITSTLISKDIVARLPFGKQNIYWFFVAVWFSWIIVLSLIKHLWTNASEKAYINSSHNEHVRRENQEVKQQIHERIDRFSAADRAKLYEFVKNGNKPISLNKSCSWYDYDSIFNSNWLDVTEKRTQHEESAIDGRTGERTTFIITDTHIAKLKPELYRDLCLIYKEDGRLGNFD